VAKFRQVNQGQSNRHRDALEFPDGKIVLLTHLCKGQRATVLQLPAAAPVKVEVTQRRFVRHVAQRSYALLQKATVDAVER
jgi:hypothetical protein